MVRPPPTVTRTRRVGDQLSASTHPIAPSGARPTVDQLRSARRARPARSTVDQLVARSTSSQRSEEPLPSVDQRQPRRSRPPRSGSVVTPPLDQVGVGEGDACTKSCEMRAAPSPRGAIVCRTTFFPSIGLDAVHTTFVLPRYKTTSVRHTCDTIVAKQLRSPHEHLHHRRHTPALARRCWASSSTAPSCAISIGRKCGVK